MNDSQNVPALAEVLQQVANGQLSVDRAAQCVELLQSSKTHGTTDAAIDLDRQQRCGFPEVVFCQGKTPQAVCDIFRALVEAGQDCLGTRATAEQAALLQQTFPKLKYNQVARTVGLEIQPRIVHPASVAVITAGTSDLPVAEEAIETLRWMHFEPEIVVDVGVAGPHRLVEQKHRFASAAAIVVVAGMEGALPSIVGGHVACPIVAVPTSVGYGASFGGLSALLGMLNSCAANVTVVNIDAGFKAGFVAGLIAKNAQASSVAK